MKKYHLKLRKQIQELNLEVLENQNFKSFLEVVNHTYEAYDNEINYLKNDLENSFKKLAIVSGELKDESVRTKTKLENIIDNIEGVIFETDLDGNFTFLNKAWTDYSGYPKKKAIGKSFKNFIKSNAIEDNGETNEKWLIEKRHLRFVFKHEKRNKLRWFEVKARLTMDSVGNASGFLGTIIDITNLKETELELKQVSQAKDEFLSTMSHEIRTPLNAVTGLTNILLLDRYLPDQEESLKALKFSGDHLLGLINDLLDYDKIRHGKLALNEKDFSLHTLLNNLKTQYVLEAQKKGIIFNLEKENEIPNNINGDELKLNQILKNLLSNSLKFTEEGYVSLSIRNLGVVRNKVSLQFRVIDTGIGIPSNQHHTIFENFVQADSEISVKYGGTGLGLSISKKLLQLQGSDLKVESDLGMGASFLFDITYKMSNRLNMYDSGMVKMQSNFNPLKINVLVAEDNRMNALILRRFFTKWKVNYEIAENGEELLLYLADSESRFDLILMDLQMPLLNGYETTKIIRSLENPLKANLPIIALTAFAQSDIKTKTESYKMNGFMSKPFNPEQLYNLLKSYSKM
ncbi:ATP-binding protein [Mariniflexile ostreae]|uniref:histidine kinase n=1 Tax=Mariniflexile ostreae TaxID=1520892 RepID=A0ABV5FCX3_9FLAO